MGRRGLDRGGWRFGRFGHWDRGWPRRLLVGKRGSFWKDNSNYWKTTPCHDNWHQTPQRTVHSTETKRQTVRKQAAAEPLSHIWSSGICWASHPTCRSCLSRVCCPESATRCEVDRPGLIGWELASMGNWYSEQWIVGQVVGLFATAAASGVHWPSIASCCFSVAFGVIRRKTLLFLWIDVECWSRLRSTDLWVELSSATFLGIPPVHYY